MELTMLHVVMAWSKTQKKMSKIVSTKSVGQW